MTPHKKTILVDFDGVIHKYSKGWADGTAYDEPMEGARDALISLMDNWLVVVFSTRPADQITEWLQKYDFPPFQVTNVKVPATAIIDDRAIRFTNWTNTLNEFEAYYGDQK